MSDSVRHAAAVLGFTGVGLGAFGAHALKKVLESRGTEKAWGEVHKAMFSQIVVNLHLIQ